MLQCKTKWKKEQLKNILEDSYAGGTPNRSREDFYGGTIPWVTSGEVNQSKIIETNEYITDLGYKNSSAKMIPKNTVLLAMYGATAGQVSILKIPASSNQAVLAIIPCKELDKNYLYHNLRYFKERMLFSAQGSGQTNLSKELVEKYKITFPTNTEEQAKIADILSICDDVIEKTEETIEKYKQIKAGMMQDLFTRGLDENGKLRPTYAQSPDLYKYSEELDRYIPKEWDTKLLEEYTTLIKDGTHGTHKDIPNGIPLLSAKDIQDGEIIISNDCRTISQLDYNSIHKSYSINVNDVLLTIVGTIGRVAIVKNIEKLFTFQRSVAIIKLVNPKFANYFYYYLLYENTQKQLLKMMNASAQGGLYLGQLANVIITMPKDEYEIKDIFNYLNQMDSKIKIEEQYLNKYKHIKQGLMKRLLTPPADAEIVEE